MTERRADILPFRQRPVQGTVPRARLRYSCKQCNGWRWVLHEDKSVVCAGCGVQAANLRVERVF